MCSSDLRIAVLYALLLALAVGSVRAQTNPLFNVRLTVDVRSAEETVRLLGDEFVNTRALAAMRGNRIAASTAGLIADRGAVGGLLTDYLDSLKYHQIIRDDVYRLEDARRNFEAIAELLKNDPSLAWVFFNLMAWNVEEYLLHAVDLMIVDPKIRLCSRL